MRSIFIDNFEKLEEGLFSANVGPHTEYHFRSEAMPKNGWGIASFFYDDSKTAWHVRRIDSQKALYQSFLNDKRWTRPTISAGNVRWSDYTVEFTMCLEQNPEDWQRTGLVFRYQTNRRFYFFGVRGNTVVLMKVNEETAFRTPDENILAHKTVETQIETSYCGRVRLNGSKIHCELLDKNGTVLAQLSAQDKSWPRGKIALQSDSPCYFTHCEVFAEEAMLDEVLNLEKAKQKEIEQLSAFLPKPVLWKKLSTKGFGVGRNLRFGDINGDGRMEIIVPQVIQHGPKDAFAEVSCVTAMDLDGNILWQNGTPHPDNWYLTNDVAVQVHDIDGDGICEVIYCTNMELIIADGKTGKIRKKVPTPKSDRDPRFPRILGDSLFFCDLRGTGRDADIIIKDRYWNFWALDEDLNTLWSGSCRTGHYPFAADIDGDGKDELAMGYALYDHDGTLLWNKEDELSDHVDGVSILDTDGSGTLKILYAASDEGFLVMDTKGTILKHHYIGHTQNPATLKLRSDLVGLQTVTINFWGNQGILHFFDAQGELYHVCEPSNIGSMCLPVNWSGAEEELFLHNTNPQWGGLYDGWGRALLRFPEDGHPDLCSAVLDLTSNSHGDCRDEIITWDQNEIWIYTQSDAPTRGPIVQRKRNKSYNNSNYQASFSLAQN